MAPIGGAGRGHVLRLACLSVCVCVCVYLCGIRIKTSNNHISAISQLIAIKLEKSKNGKNRKKSKINPQSLAMWRAMSAISDCLVVLV